MPTPQPGYPKPPQPKAATLSEATMQEEPITVLSLETPWGKLTVELTYAWQPITPPPPPPPPVS